MFVNVLVHVCIATFYCSILQYDQYFSFNNTTNKNFFNIAIILRILVSELC